MKMLNLGLPSIFTLMADLSDVTPVDLGSPDNRKKSLLTEHRKIEKGSRYTPHQGKQECERRLRQMKAVS